MKLWEMLKASKGIPVADPMAVLWGYQYRKKHGVAEISGVPPFEFTSRGEQLLDYQIYGNTVQDGTPTPENPVEAQGCGERTENRFVIPVTVGGANLFDYNWLWTKENVKLNDYFNCITIAMKPNTEYTISNNYRVLKSPKLVETALVVVNSETEITTVNGGVDRIRTVTTASDGLLRIAYRIHIDKEKYQDIVVNRDTLADGTYYIQINEGSSASPYEPYHEPITTPVYIGSEPLHKIGDYADYVDYKRGVVVRRIKKLVLTGEEDWRLWSSGQTAVERYFYKWGKTVPSNYGLICTHFPFSRDDGNFEHARIGGTYRDDFIIFISKTIAQSSDDFKSYLSAQYEAGTPVTIWYVLTEPEEELLENLLPIQTIKGTNILTADTTVQPSEMYLKGKIKQIT